ncbi:MAG: putative nucleotidyltransferase substrate binding domain-containing protein, partial [Pseudomonadota bacterium]
VDAQLLDEVECIDKVVGIGNQSTQMRRGEAPDNYVDPATLSRLHRQNLKAAFSQVRTSQQALLNRFHIA